MLKKLLLLSFSFVLCFGAGELFVRIFFPQQLVLLHGGEIWKQDSLLGWKLKSDVETRVNTGEGPVHFVTDSKGYRIGRGKRGILPGGEDRVRIIAIGDSFIEAPQVEWEETAPQVLGQLLRQNPAIEVEVVNDGVSHWDPNQYYVEAKRVLEEETCDLGLIFLYLGNDFVKEFRTTFDVKEAGFQTQLRWPRELNWEEFIMSVLYPLNDFLERRSHLFVFVKYRTQYFLTRLGLTANYFPEIFLLEEKESERWEIMVKNCERIYREFQRRHVPVYFVLLPAVYQVEEDIFYEYLENFKIPLEAVRLEQPNAVLQSLLAPKSIPLIDPLVPMRQFAKEGGRLYGSIDAHLNQDGHRVVARAVRDRLVRDKVFSRFQKVP